MKILIELPTWLGDCVMATPAIENILNLHPESIVTVIGSPTSIKVLEFHPRVKKRIIFNKSYYSLIRQAINIGKFDLFFSFRGSLRSSIFKFFISCPRKFQFNKNSFNNQHQVEKYNNFINRALEINSNPKKLKIFLDPNFKKKYSTKKFLGINPGAKYGSSKRWYPDKFFKVSKELSSQYHIILFGGKEEKDISGEIADRLLDAGIEEFTNLAGKTSLKELIEKISTLDLFITGDSGPMHIAAAFQIPTVSIFGSTNDIETNQWQNIHSVNVKKKLDCQPCMQRECPLKHHNCMKLIKSREVIEAVQKINY